MIKRRSGDIYKDMRIGKSAFEESIKKSVKKKLDGMKVNASFMVKSNNEGFDIEFEEDLILLDSIDTSTIDVDPNYPELNKRLKFTNKKGTGTIILRDLSPKKNIPNIRKKYLANSFPELKGRKIPITFSYEEPPIFGKEGKFKDIEKGAKLPNYPICDLLGKYDPQTKSITIYLLGILRATKDEVNNPGYNNLTKLEFYHRLLKIVIIHEIGHFWFHNLMNVKNSNFNNPFTCSTIDEWIAQMFAYLCLKTQNEKDFIIEFANKQPEEYKSFQNNKDLSIADFKDVSESLRLSHVYQHCSKSDNLMADIVRSIKNLPQDLLDELNTSETKDLFKTLDKFPV